MSEIALIILSLCGVIYLCDYYYKKGVIKGAENAIDMLHEQKIIAYKTDGEIYPHPFYTESRK